ncbi:MAG: NAD(P)/FAD-dependent oxidoreductase [Propionibacteriales bacterium]|nr:NAD(P)/FAD-dependent oxidoreductase [Propionibacteriales bacterium]
MSSADLREVEVAIVGAGFSGLGTGIALDRVGLRDWVILEDGDGVGGTWHWNTYPGVAVDIPSFSYQFSFAQRADWSRTYAPGRELKRYAEDCADAYGLRDRIRFSTRVERAAWSAEDNRWILTTAGGAVVRARFLINGSGVLTTPNLPNIPGVESFAGRTLHTARWDHGVDLVGQKVGVIGTGASAVQLVPEIAPQVAALTVFQRTPIWCFPKADVRLSGAARRALRTSAGRSAGRLLGQAFVEVTFPLAAHFHTRFPLAGRMESVAKAWLSSQVRDPETRAKLTPAYGVGCKRPSFHNGYLATFNRENVHLETEAIDEITPTGIRTRDGVEHPLDVLVLATGFKGVESDNIPTYDLVGESGETLGEFWDRNRAQAYQGVSVPGFPNFFTVFGPYGYNGASYFALIEAQTHHIVRCLTRAREVGADRVEVTAAANDRYFAEMMRRRPTQVFWQDSCSRANSYYFDQHGDVALRRSTTWGAARESRTFDLDDYQFTGAAVGARR